MAHSVKHLTLDFISGNDLRVMGSNPLLVLDSLLSGESARDSLPLSPYTLPPLPPLK